MTKRSKGTSNWLFNTLVVSLFVASMLYLVLYVWPHSQGRSSPLDKYTPVARRILAKMGFAPKSGSTEVQQGGKRKTAARISPKAVRSYILESAEWVNPSELDAIDVSGRSVTVLVKARMTNEQVLAASREIFVIVFDKIDEVASLRVLVYVKTRDATAGGSIRNVLRSDMSMSRRTYEAVNWSKTSPAKLPKAADRAKVYF